MVEGEVLQLLEQLHLHERVLASMRAWTGPRDADLDASRCKLLAPVPPERWPYGPPSHHEEVCTLHAGGLFCDCRASDASDDELGIGGWPTQLGARSPQR